MQAEEDKFQTCFRCRYARPSVQDHQVRCHYGPPTKLPYGEFPIVSRHDWCGKWESDNV